ncbi:MAG TPA: hypothetical protein VE782_14345 [Myxococcaceae bacterium]|jgi:hypothetical protein|nr:hypothetical protein [Myxococcaceae bacterium]
MRAVVVLGGAIALASACSLLVNFDPEGQSCGAGGGCLAGYVCVDGLCKNASRIPDAGYAFFEVLLSGSQVDPPTSDPSSGSGRFEYDYGAKTLRWSIDHDAGQEAFVAAIYVGHPGWTASDPQLWNGLGSAQTPITGSISVTDAGPLLEELTRGHLYVALKNQWGWEIIRGYVVAPGGRIYAAPIYSYDPTTFSWSLVARAGLVAYPDAGTLYYDVTTEGRTDFDSAHIHDRSANTTLVDTPWMTSPGNLTRSSGRVALPDRVLPLLDTPYATYYDLHSTGPTSSGTAEGDIERVMPP